VQNLEDLKRAVGTEEGLEAALLGRAHARAKSIRGHYPVHVDIELHTALAARLGDVEAFPDSGVSLSTHWAKVVAESDDAELAELYLFDVHGRARS
jgi:hypothetical protein